jgi:hypothetical protein
MSRRQVVWVSAILAWATLQCACGAREAARPLPATVTGTPTSASLGATSASAVSTTAAPTVTLKPTSSPAQAPPTATLAASVTARPPTPTALPPSATAVSLTPTVLPHTATALASSTAIPSTSTPMRQPTTQAPTAGKRWALGSLVVGPGRLYVHQFTPAPGAPSSWDESRTKPHEADRLLVSDDGGQSWSPFAGGLPPGGTLYYLTMEYSQRDALYATTDGGLYRWAGSRWELVSESVRAPVAVGYRAPEKLWVMRPDYRNNDSWRLNRSVDGGKTWEALDAGIVRWFGPISLGFDPRDSGIMYRVSDGAPIKRPPWIKLERGDGGTHWSSMPWPSDPPGRSYDEPSPLSFGGWSIDGASGALYVAVAPGGQRFACPPWQIWRTLNPRVTEQEIRWELVHDFGPATSVTLLASGSGLQGVVLYALLQPVSPDVACYYQNEGRFSGPKVLNVSVDGGQTWTSLPLPDQVD